MTSGYGEVHQVRKPRYAALSRVGGAWRVQPLKALPERG